MIKPNDDTDTFERGGKWYWNPLNEDLAGVGPFSSEKEARKDAITHIWMAHGAYEHPSHMLHEASTATLSLV